MIRRITVRKGGLYATFLTLHEYKRQYGARQTYCSQSQEKIAFDDNVHMLLLGKEFGFYGLPMNNNNVQKGIDQDGNSFLNNYYSARQLLWQFKWFVSSAIVLDQVFFQNNETLKIEVETDNATFISSNASLVNRFEGGAVEMMCHNAFWNVQGEDVNDCFTIPLVSGEIILINEANQNGFLVDDVYFGESNITNTTLITVDIFASPVYTISGQWQGIRVINETTGSNLYVNGTCLNSCVIDTTDNTVTIDGVDYTALANGIYPILASGTNTIRVEFDEVATDVQACYNFPRRTGSIY